MEEFEITASNGRTYKSLRAYHIALGHAVRQALLDFYKDVKKYAISEVQKYYDAEFQGSEFYDNTYGMLNALIESDDINGAITYAIKGNWEGNTTFNIGIDWSKLDGHSNGYGQWGTYTSLNGEDVTDIWNNLLESGLPKGILSITGERHPSFNLGEKVENYIKKNLNSKIQQAINSF